VDLLICHHCGNLIRERDKFCSECGLKVSALCATTSSRTNITLEPMKASASGAPQVSQSARLAFAAVEAAPAPGKDTPAPQTFMQETPPVQPAESSRQADFFAGAPHSPSLSAAVHTSPVVPVPDVSTSTIVAAEPPVAPPQIVAAAIAASPPPAVAVQPALEPPSAVAMATVSLAPPVVAEEEVEPPPSVKPRRPMTVSALWKSGSKLPLKHLIPCALSIIAALIVLSAMRGQLLSGFTDQGIWLFRYTPIGLPESTMYVQLQSQGIKLTGTPVVAGGNGVSGFFSNGQVLLTQRQSYSTLHPLQLKGVGDLSPGKFRGQITRGGSGKWMAQRMTWMELMFRPPSSEWLRDQFSKSLIAFFLLSCALIYGSLKLFGPNGFVNIKSRKQYVPSRYKNEHARMLAQFGKPLMAGSLPLGTRVDWAPWHVAPRQLNMPPEIRRKDPHIVIVGGSGKGKTRLMAGMVAHDIECGDRAVVIVDPDGTLSDLVVRHIAAHADAARIVKRLHIIDGTREEPVSFNPIAEPLDGQLQNMASSVVAGFRAIYMPVPGAQQTWSQQTAHILRSALLLLSVNGRSLSDLPALLTDNDERDLLLQRVDCRQSESAELLMIAESWARYRKLARSEHWLDWVEPILNRVQPVLGDPKLNAIIATGQNDIDFQKVLRKRGIVIVKLPRARFGDHASLVGSLLVGCVQNAALSLSTEEECRNPASIYLDDFSAFIDKDMFQLVTGDTRRYGLGLVCAARSLQEIPEDYRNVVLNNVGTLCTFACAPKDAEALGKQMFRVDGRQAKQRTIAHIFNAVNTTISNYDLIADEEKLNVDRIIGQEDRTYFCYRVGSVAGVFNLRAPEFPDIDRDTIDSKVVSKAYMTYKDKEGKK
jgi:hypothetical protein